MLQGQENLVPCGTTDSQNSDRLSPTLLREHLTPPQMNHLPVVHTHFLG